MGPQSSAIRMLCNYSWSASGKALPNHQVLTSTCFTSELLMTGTVAGHELLFPIDRDLLDLIQF